MWYFAVEALSWLFLVVAVIVSVGTMFTKAGVGSWKRRLFVPSLIAGALALQVAGFAASDEFIAHVMESVRNILRIDPKVPFPPGPPQPPR